ncbi:TetR/AcrR family transcriptional regulator [Crassaminicella profunda]|uniref:TetR/AcrR family transcriptional regulator n=1 Tax=Crassaminicella profunda TaxID=1286698 RepID=UPI001CA69ED8|nr:TetR/AcrR family transcriptional regulator [Crassaminicella profunda]QZY54696.1 TetR/AcrR family transcriptional regulator [Crassaminicella profunda]
MKRNAKETEKKILEAAISIFSKKGFSAATTNEIAKEAGVAEGTIFKYYPRKKDLLHTAMIKAIHLFVESMAVDSLKAVIKEKKEASIEELLKAVIMDRIKFFEKHCSLIKVIFYELQFHEDLRELFLKKLLENIPEIVSQIFKERKQKGEIKDVNSVIVMRSFMGMVLSMILQRQFIPQVNQMDHMEEEIELIVDIFLNGIKR